MGQTVFDTFRAMNDWSNYTSVRINLTGVGLPALVRLSVLPLHSLKHQLTFPPLAPHARPRPQHANPLLRPRLLGRQHREPRKPHPSRHLVSSAFGLRSHAVGSEQPWCLAGMFCQLVSLVVLASSVVLVSSVANAPDPQFHCHIAWHTSEGMILNFIEGRYVLSLVSRVVLACSVANATFKCTRRNRASLHHGADVQGLERVDGS
jgi:hypothetical protein